MDPVAKKTANLRVLQRHDPQIADILDAASHVVVYRFDDEKEAWDKVQVEGTMFVTRSTRDPPYGFFIINRSNLNNFSASLSSEMDIDVTGDYVIYKTGDDHTYGLWISEVKDRNRIGNLIQDLCKQIGNTQPSMPKSTVNAGLDLLSLLRRAKEEHDHASVQPGPFYTTSPTVPPASAGPLANDLPMPPWAPGVPLRSLADFFLCIEALPPAAPKGSLSKLEVQGRAVHLLTNGVTFLNNFYDAYLLMAKQ
ncbi:hypothetical protein DFJ74DRAFT_707172 [Hyaloraphidium curvatum]|nr:hypothetical protein DFJ74DRAFT_707172 [Hyaloraphidium curvatum]